MTTKATELNTLDRTDAINRLYLAMNGQPTGRKYKSSDIGYYIDYIKAMLASKTVTVDKSATTISDATKESPEFFSNYSATVKQQSKLISLAEESVLHLISLLKDNALSNSALRLSSNEYNFIYGASINDLTSFINSLNIPKIEKVPKNNKYVQEIIEASLNDQIFHNSFVIKNVFKPHLTKKKFSKEDGWKKKTVVHGTSNQSLLQILDSGFKTASQLRRDGVNFNYSGNMFGDAIYFARVDQISKPIYYMDNKMKTCYIIVADIFYKNVQETSSAYNYKYDGETLVWAKGQGQYDRDELMVLPNQINIRYILEVSRK